MSRAVAALNFRAANDHASAERIVGELLTLGATLPQAIDVLRAFCLARGYHGNPPLTWAGVQRFMVQVTAGSSLTQ